MKPRIPASTRLARAFTITSLFSCLSTGSLFAADGTWNVTASGNWSDTTKWNAGAGPVADGVDAIANFNVLTGQAITLDSGRTVGTLNFTNSTTNVLSGSGGLTLARTTGTPVIDGTATISAAIAGTQGLSFQPGGSRTLTLSGNNTYTGITAMASGGRINIQSNNALGASGAGNHTTITYVNNAAVQLHFQPNAGNGNALTSAENFTLRNNSITVTAAGAGGNFIYNDSTGTTTPYGSTTLTGGLTLDRTASSSTGVAQFFGLQGAAGTLNIQGSVQGAASSGQPLNTVVDPTRLQFRTTATNGVVHVSGVISDGTLTTGGLSVYTSTDATGIARLSGANTYTGSTVHQKGTMLINNTTGSGTGVGAVTVAATAIFGGTGIVAPSGTTTVNAVTTNNGVTFNSGAIVAPGDVSASGTSQVPVVSSIAAGENLTFDLSATAGKVTFASGATISIDLNALSSTVAESFAFTGLIADSGLVPATADVVFNSNTVNFSVSATALADGLYTLATFDAANAYSGAWVLGSGLSAYTDKNPTLIFNANSIQLQIGSIPEPSSFAMLGGFAALGFAAVGRRRRK